ncbi:leucine-rich repeat-containing protein 66 isoform X2 [Choloepus didactylus]|uniref:leucine-rich repeat-containing protein 66 isoform X2 n=1 Tax=Choloepus didactylus TaxID=27675 RepID=UPI00189CD033|nr:leucine-rich repeat-containing protein 66 isoform X2 [Choloepus didactylus]
MKNLYFRVISIVIGLCFTGTMSNTLRKSNILSNSECQWNGYLLMNCSFIGKHNVSVDVSQKGASVDISFNFIRLPLRSNMKQKEWKIKHLDLSNSVLSKITLSTLAYLHVLEILNLSNNAIYSISLELPRHKSLWMKHHRSSFRNRLPFLKVLILQRNKLSDTPKGLWTLKSLQSLDLSFNEISQVGLTDFHNCIQLENLYLKSNKIFRIHPEAFKDLKKLQVVDLSSNSLTTILPMMAIALTLPQLEADLADNHWWCDHSVTVFQGFISESWRKKWNAICNKSIENEEAYWWIPKGRISKETHLPHVNLSHMKNLITSKAERGKKAPVSSESSEKPRQLPRWVRSARDVQTANSEGDTSQDLALAICLSVFITFIVAFFLGAFTRPYADRLWQQRCQNKSPASEHVYSNEGFYDEIEAAGNIQHPMTQLCQAFRDPNLYQNQDAFSVIEPSPHAAVTHDRTLGTSRKEPGSRQSTEQHEDNIGAGNRSDPALPNDSAACSVLRQHPNAEKNELISAAQDHIYRNDVFRELNYKAVAQEDSLGEPPMSISSVAGRLQSGSGSLCNDSNVLDPSLSREMTASLSKMLTHTKSQSTGENEERWGIEELPAEPAGSWVEFSKERQVSTYINSLSTRQQSFKGATAEEDLPAYYSVVTHSDPGDTDPSVFPPRWGSDCDVTHTNKAPMQNHAPSDTQSELETNYNSDEGSLFTLSSVSSEGARNLTEEETHGEESCKVREPLGDENSGVRVDSVMSLENLEDNVPFQRIPWKCESQEDHFEKPLISGPDPELCETHQKRASNNSNFEDPTALPRSLGSSPLSDEIPGVFTYDCVIAPESELAEWHCSLRDLDFSNVGNLPPTPPCSPEVPSDLDKSACHKSDSDICTYKPFCQGTDANQKDSPHRITSGEHIGPSQNSEGDNMQSNTIDTHAHEESVRPPEDNKPRKVKLSTIVPIQGDEPALQCERGEGKYFEDSSKSQVPLLQELSNKTSSLRTQEHFNDID